ncbi:MAG: sensor histidine kinase [Oscillospiraceae bacterium]
MKLADYLKSKALSIVLFIVILIAVFAVMRIYFIPHYTIFYTLIIISAGFLIPFLLEFFKKRNFYGNLDKITDKLDRPYLLSEIIDKPNFFEGRKLYDVLKLGNKSMNDEIAKYKISTNEYQEYVEKWVHEIKTPIAACKLAVENRSENSWAELSEDLDKIEKYVNQTLFYSRVNNAEKDYIIRKHTLNELVANSLKSNSKTLIRNGFSIKRESLDITVMTDEKWISFILDQIISNSVKYKKENPVISFSGRKTENGVFLKISDNGVGISAEDLPRIFEKNFTGGNGRLNSRSTGFGLYLCKKLCDKMGIDISAESQQGIETDISIFFPKNQMTDV